MVILVVITFWDFLGSRFVYCSIHVLHAPADSRGVLVRPVRVMGIRSLLGQHGFSSAYHHLVLAASSSWSCCAVLLSLTTGLLSADAYCQSQATLCCHLHRRTQLLSLAVRGRASACHRMAVASSLMVFMVYILFWESLVLRYSFMRLVGHRPAAGRPSLIYARAMVQWLLWFSSACSFSLV